MCGGVGQLGGLKDITFRGRLDLRGRLTPTQTVPKILSRKSSALTVKWVAYLYKARLGSKLCAIMPGGHWPQLLIRTSTSFPSVVRREARSPVVANRTESQDQKAENFSKAFRVRRKPDGP
jgi:hypothetical protein